VKEYLTEHCQKDYDRRMRNACAMNNYAEAKEALQKIFRQLERIKSERCPQPGGRAGRNADGTSLGCGSGVAAETDHHQPDRIVLVDGAAGGTERKVLARRRSAAELDRHRPFGSIEKVSAHQRL